MTQNVNILEYLEIQVSVFASMSADTLKRSFSRLVENELAFLTTVENDHTA